MTRRTEQAAYFGKLAALLKGGIPLLKAMEVSLERVNDPELRDALERVLKRCWQGTCLTDSFTEEAAVFPTEIRCLIATGEESGDLEEKAKAIAEGLSSGAFESRVGDGPEVSPFDRLIEDALAIDATAVHLVPVESGVAVRCRVSGKLKEVAVLGESLALDLVERIHLRCGLDAEPFPVPLSGECVAGGRALSASFCPLAEGESLVLRIEAEKVEGPRLIDLGLSEEQAALVARWLVRPNGFVLVAGPPGSGRQSMLAALMGRLDAATSRLFAIARGTLPRIPGVGRITTGVISRAAALRSAMDQDLDAVMLDEIPDRDTAAVATRVARLGHLVLAGVNARGAAEGIGALLEFGLAGEDVAELTLGVIALSGPEGGIEVLEIDDAARRTIIEDPDPRSLRRHLSGS
jgi:type II secretory ATPase GspE/PulE/Tfp pilus assembly ATPase PilB-like protein